MILALVTSVFAFGSNDMAIVVSCDSAVFATWPVAGDEDIPVDTVPMALAEWCVPSDSVIARLYSGDELLFEERFDNDGLSYGVLEADVELEADTDYQWTLTPSSGEETLVEFRTGSELAEVGTELPRTVDTWESWSRRYGSGYFGMTVAPGEQPEGNRTVIELLDEGGEVLQRGVQWDVGGDVGLNLEFDERPTDLCVRPSQRQVDGTWIDGELHCEEKIGGCSTAAAAVGLLPALLVLLGLRRRR